MDALTGGGGQLASTALSGVVNAFGAKRSYKRQKRLMRMQMDYQTKEREATQAYNERLWREKMAYDSPMAVMQRLKAAGISPDLAFAGGNVSQMFSTSDSPQATPQTAPSAPTPAGIQQSMQAASDFGNIFMKAAQLDNLNSATDKNKTESRKNDSITLLNGEQMALTKSQREWTDENKKYIQSQIRTSEATAEKIRKEISLIPTKLAGMKLDNATKEQSLKEARQSFDDRMKIYVYNRRKALADAGVSEKTLANYQDYMDAIIDEIDSRSYYESTQGHIAAQDLNMTELTNAALKQVRNKEGDNIFTIMAEVTAATLENNSALLSKNLELLENYGDAEAIIGMVTQSLGTLLHAVTAAIVGSRLGGAGKVARGATSATVMPVPDFAL
nr:MAG: DNA pilot protein [Microvirus Sku14]